MNTRENTRELFERLIDTPAERRQDVLLEVTRGAPSLRDELERLLRLDDGQAESDEFVLKPGHAAVDAAWDHPADSANPGSIAGYRVIRRLGSGGMGIVFEVEHPQFQRAALKIVHPALCAPPVIDRFRKEAMALERCASEHVARVYHHGHTDLGFGVQPFLVMELVAGVPVTRAATSLPLADRILLCLRIAQGLARIHESGVIHGDLKPANIVVRADGTPCIVDFGLARLVTTSSEYTAGATGGWAGTLQYMSPEQLGVVQDPVDERSDLYALGLVLYEILSGKRPYEMRGLSLSSVIQLVRIAQPSPMRSTSQWPWPSLDLIIRRLLRQSPEDRYPTADAVAADLQQVIEGNRPHRSRVSPATARRAITRTARRSRRAIASLAVLGIVLSFAAALRNNSTPIASVHPSEFGSEIQRRQRAAVGRSGVPGLMEEAYESDESVLHTEISVFDLNARLSYFAQWHRWDDLLVKSDAALSRLSRSDGPDHSARLTVVHLSRARALTQLNRRRDAEIAIARALEHYSVFKQKTNMLAILLIEYGQLERASSVLHAKLTELAGEPPTEQVTGLRARSHGLLASIALLQGDERSYTEHLDRYVSESANLDTRALPWRPLISTGRRSLATRFIHDYLERTETAAPDVPLEVHSKRAHAFHDLGSQSWIDGDFEQATSYFGEAVQLFTTAKQAFAPERFACMQSLGVCLRDQGLIDEALPHLRESYAQCLSRTGKNFPTLAGSQITLAKCLYFAGEFPEAQQLAREAHSYTSRRQETAPLKWVETATVLALTQIELGAVDEAIGLLEESRSTVELADNAQPWDTAIVDLALGRLHLALDKTTEAQLYLTAGLEVLRPTRGATYPWTTLGEQWLTACE